MIKAIPNIDFADSNFLECKFKERQLIVIIELWDEKIFTATFENTIYFNYRGGDFLSEIYILDEKKILIDALAPYYGINSKCFDFKVFAIKDINDSNFLEIVAEKLIGTL